MHSTPLASPTAEVRRLPLSTSPFRFPKTSRRSSNSRPPSTERALTGLTRDARIRSVTSSERARAWLRDHGGVALAFAGLSAMAASTRGAAPGSDLKALARALGAAADSAQVSPNDLRWESSAGALADLVFGRRVLFLQRAARAKTRGTFGSCPRALVSRGGVLDGVVDARDVTNTPLGDDHELVVSGMHAAFATRAYGQEQSITMLDLGGEGAQDKTESPLSRSRIMAAHHQHPANG